MRIFATLNLVIDDTLIPRQSETAPGSAIRHDHAKKTNRPQFLQAQCWVTLGVSVLGNGRRKYVLPIMSRLVPIAGNRNKLTIALALVRGLAQVVMNKPVRILFDAWFMRARLVLPLLSRKMRVIGQVRLDTALFLPAVVFFKPGRGRPKKYGVKMTPEAIQALPVTELKLTLYGKEQLIRLRSVVAMARFLKGTPVRAVWCSFYDTDKQSGSKARLLLATKVCLSLVAEESFTITVVAQWLRMEFTGLACRDGSSGSPRYSPSQNSVATPDCGCSVAASRKKQPVRFCIASASIVPPFR